MKEKKLLSLLFEVAAYIGTIAGVVIGPCLIIAGGMSLAASLFGLAGIGFIELDSFKFGNPLLAALCVAGGIGLIVFSQVCQDMAD